MDNDANNSRSGRKSVIVITCKKINVSECLAYVSNCSYKNIDTICKKTSLGLDGHKAKNTFPVNNTRRVFLHWPSDDKRISY